MKNSVEFHTIRQKRMMVFYGLFIALFVILTSGLFWRQLINKEDYLEQEELQSLRRILQPGPRGEVYDREGRLLVGNRPVFTAAIFLGELRSEFRKEYYKRVKMMRNAGVRVNRDHLRSESRQRVVQKYVDHINKILGRDIQVSSKDLERHFRKRLLLPMPVIKDLKPEEYARLTEQLTVESPIQVIVDSARYYPYGTLAAHVLGYVGQTAELEDGGLPGDHLTTFSLKGKVGKNGLEYSYNDVLQGVTGGEIWMVDPAGFQYENIAKKIPQKGQSIKTSLDIELQMEAESCLQGKVGAIVAIEVETGEVLAMASSPTFDLNDLTPYIPWDVYDDINARGAWMNRATQGLYPPASPFKVITSSCLLRHGVVEPTQTFRCGGSYTIGGRAFHEHNLIGFGDVDMYKGIAVSSNVYFFNAIQSLYSNHLIDEAKLFALDQPTGIDLPFETKRMFVPDNRWKMNRFGESWRTGDTANMCIGQGYLLVTPLQMACFAAAFARNETRIVPTMIHNPNNTGKSAKSRPIGISPANRQVLLDGMRRAVNGGGAKYAAVNGLDVAAKTGTGQIRKNGKEAVIPWCVGFAPVDNPKIAFAITIEGEDDTLWGSTTAGPLAQRILSTYYYKYLADNSEA